MIHRFLDSSSYLVVGNQIIKTGFLFNTPVSSGLLINLIINFFINVENGAGDKRQQMWCGKKGEHQRVACFGGL